MCIAVYVEDSDGVVQRVWEDVVLACVPYGVSPYCGVYAYGRCEVAGVLGNICVGRWVGCDYSLLKELESVGFRLVSPGALE